MRGKKCEYSHLCDECVQWFAADGDEVSVTRLRMEKDEKRTHKKMD